jgi:hypothetical protein
VTTSALALEIQGITDPVIPFRDQEDAIHMLTPAQAIEMGLAVQNFVSGTYQWAWAKKAELAAAADKVTLDAITLE